MVCVRLQAVTRLQPVFLWRALLRVIGSLDTFDLLDLFDSVGNEPPQKPLDYVLLSIPSVLVRDLPWMKSAIA